MGKTKIKTIDESVQEPIKQAISVEEKITEPKVKKEKTSTRTQKKSEPKRRGKKYQEAREKVDPTQKYSLADAIKLAKETSFTKFPGTLEAHLNTNVKNIRGLISLPYFAGKKLIILAFPSTGSTSSLQAGSGQVVNDLGDGVIIGTDETISQIEAGKINFDVLVTTPNWMPKLAKLAKLLGPRSLMPNPKNGTITENLGKTVAELQGGKMEYKTEKDGKVIHLSVGKVDQNTEEIVANIKVLFNIIGKSKISKITLSPTMGVGVRVDLTTI